MSSTDGNSLALSFPFWIPVIFLSHLIAVGRIFHMVWSRSGESGHPCPVLQLVGRGFQLFTFECFVDCGVNVNGLYCVEISSFYTHFGEILFLS